MLLDDVVYWGVPPEMVKVNVEHIPVIVETVGGLIDNATGSGSGSGSGSGAIIVTAILSDFPAAEAVMFAVASNAPASRVGAL